MQSAASTRRMSGYPRGSPPSRSNRAGSRWFLRSQKSAASTTAGDPLFEMRPLLTKRRTEAPRMTSMCRPAFSGKKIEGRKCELLHICSPSRLLASRCWGLQGPVRTQRRRDIVFRARRRIFFGYTCVRHAEHHVALRAVSTLANAGYKFPPNRKGHSGHEDWIASPSEPSF
jgi:hypothetical protein